MKQIRILTALAALLALAACTKDELRESSADGPRVRISAGLEEDSKIAFTDANTSLQLAWQAGDAVRVISNSGSSAFHILPGFTAHAAQFEGEAVITGPYTILYPGTYASVADLEARDLSTQVQAANNSTAHLQYNAVLSGVSDYSSFAFTSAWASANGATLRENAVLKLKIALPTGISNVSNITFTTDTETLYRYNAGNTKTDTFSLDVTDGTVSDDGGVFTAYFDLSMKGGAFLAATRMSLYLTTDTGTYFKMVTPGAKTFSAGKMYTIVINDGWWNSPSLFAGGSGTEADPYLIGNYVHMNNMEAVLIDGETVWFELISNVNMDPVDAGYWTPLNTVSTYDKGVHFDGKGHTIRNFTINGGTLHNGMFSILNGTVQNVTFENPKIIDTGYPSTTNHDVGIITGFCGYSSNGKEHWGTIQNVTIKNGEISTNNKLHTGGVGFGAIAGTGSRCTISHCKVDGFSLTDQDGDGEVPNIVGGVVGRTNGIATVEYTQVKGLNLAGFSFQGGILGYHNTTGTVIIDSCKTGGAITGKQYLGGILGGAAATAVNLTLSRLESSAAVTSDHTTKAYIGGIAGGHSGNITISDSRSSSVIRASSATGETGVGGILGYCAKSATLTGCAYTGNLNTTGDYVGGILGYGKEGTTITGCRCSGTVICGGVRQGGICGFLGSVSTVSSLTDCIFSGTLGSNTSSSTDVARFVGGMVGAGYGATIERCLVTGAIGVNNHDTTLGGICGYINKCTIRNCEFRGTFPRATSNIGGIVSGVAGASTITCCKVPVSITGSYTLGGIVAYCNNDTNTITVSNNFCKGTLKGVIATAGVVGRMGRTSGSFVCSGNLVYCPSITATRPGDCNSYRSSATIIGEIDGTAYTLNNTNWYSSSLSFTDGASGVSDRKTTTLEQTGTYNSSNKLTWTYSATYYQPYFGRKTTDSAVTKAAALNWSTTYWNLSGSEPMLKNLPVE